MQFPSLPTDNLYKFCAIAGIALILFGATYPLQKILDLRLRLADDAVSIDITKKQQEFLIADVKQQKHDVGNVYSYAQKLEHEKHVSDKQIANLTSENDVAVKHQHELVSSSRKIQLNIARLHGEVQKAGILSSHIKYVSAVCIFSMFYGFVLMMFGFRRWYVLVQMPQDRIISNQADGLSSSPTKWGRV